MTRSDFGHTLTGWGSKHRPASPRNANCTPWNLSAGRFIVELAKAPKMAESILEIVIEHLAEKDSSVRDIALNWLCEGYMDEPLIAQTVFEQWDRMSPEEAFPQFPMLSYFPVPADRVPESCLRAEEMSQRGVGLTDPVTRCGGKLLEQVMRLPATALANHIAQIEATAATSKIFFRIDVDGLRQRVELIDKPADDLAQLLDAAVEGLGQDPNDRFMVRQGLNALEALRSHHPDYMDLGAVLAAPQSTPTAQASFRLTLQSLAQFPGGDSLEEKLAQHLQSEHESILSLAVEALVRSGTGPAAEALLGQFAASDITKRKWIARGLQRMRVHNLAPLIGQLRDQISDDGLWHMLLVAEMQQLDPNSGLFVSETLGQLNVSNQALIDAGMLYVFVCSPLQENISRTALEEAYRDYLVRVQSGMRREDGRMPGQDMHELRKRQSKKLSQAYKNRRRK